MKPLLNLHIGRPKTGSTALQRFLARNSAALRERGLLYPETGRYQQASHHFAHAYARDLRPGIAAADASADELWRALRREVEAAGAESVLLSSENLWFVKPGQLPARLEEDFNVRVFAYVRRQDNALASSFCEEVKGGHVELHTDIEAYALQESRLRLLDYLHILSPWGERFGDDRIVVRVYEDAATGGIERDFCRALGLETEGLAIDSAPVNPGFPYDLLQLIEHARGYSLGLQPRRELHRALSEAVSLLPPDPRYDTGGLFSRELRERILDRFAKSNAALVSRFGCGRGGELFPALDGESFVAPSEQLDPDRLARLLMGALVIQERRNHRLDRRLRRLEAKLEALAREDRGE